MTHCQNHMNNPAVSRSPARRSDWPPFICRVEARLKPQILFTVSCSGKEVNSWNVNLLFWAFSAIIRQETGREAEENNMCRQDFQACISCGKEHSRHLLPTELTVSLMFICQSFCVSEQSSFPAAWNPVCNQTDKHQGQHAETLAWVSIWNGEPVWPISCIQTQFQITAR